MTSAINDLNLLDELNIKIPVKEQIKKELKSEDILSSLDISITTSADEEEIKTEDKENVLDDLNIEIEEDDILTVERIDQWVEYLRIKHIRAIYNYR
jgi:hypothetical protein